MKDKLKNSHDGKHQKEHFRPITIIHSLDALKLGPEWSKCPICEVLIKRNNFNKHLKKMHKDEVEKYKDVDIKTLLEANKPKRRALKLYSAKEANIREACPGCGAVGTCYCK